MKIQQFELENFRSIKLMHMDFSSKTTALVGVNGAGKSSVLDALAIALSNLTVRIVGQAAKARTMSPDDIQIGTSYVRLQVRARFDGQQDIDWTVVRNRTAGKSARLRRSNLEALNKQATLFATRLEYHEPHAKPVTLPLAVYYDIHRAIRTCSPASHQARAAWHANTVPRQKATTIPQAVHSYLR